MLYRYPQSRLPLRVSWWPRTPRAVRTVEQPEFELAGHRHLRRKPLLRRHDRVCQGRSPDDILITHHRPPIAGPTPATLHLLPHPLAAQHLVLGQHAGCEPNALDRPGEDGGATLNAPPPELRDTGGSPDRSTRAAIMAVLYRERNQSRRCCSASRAAGSVQGRRSTTSWCTARSDAVISDQARGTKAAAPLPLLDRAARREVVASACGCGTTTRRKALASASGFRPSVSTGSLPERIAEADAFFDMPRSHDCGIAD